MVRRKGRPKAGEVALSRELILDTALQLVDEKGMKGLSMRRLAARLEVDPMAIYHYVPNKRALLTGLVEIVFSELEIPATAEVNWLERIRLVAGAYYNLARTHPNLILYLATDTRVAAGAALKTNEALFQALLVAGLPAGMVVMAADLIIDYTNGFALGEAARQLKGADERQDLLRQLDSQPADQFPAIRSVFSQLAPADLSDNFEAGLEIILQGLESLAEKQKTEARTIFEKFTGRPD